MKKPLAVYLIACLIFATAVAYFISASFGERLERSNHEAKAAVETGHESSEVTTPQPQTTKNNHNVAGGQVKQTLNNTYSVNEYSTQRNKEATSSNGNESARRSIEFPLFLTARTAYTIVGLWMVIEKKITKIPYIISIGGSLLLIGLYTLSHTVGLPPIGLEQIGFLDLTLGALQVAIVACCGYVLLTSKKIFTKSIVA
ncbi:MAG TPA: hypothetical protein VEP90_30335 [Methylomirabilota bacterium]|nr:hypothetical protein [Methylomirabilota bacterium]